MNTFQNQWKQTAASKSITRYDMALLALVKATKKDKPLEQASYYLSKSLRPITNQKKIAHGAYPYYAMWDAVRHVEHSSMAKCLDEETLSKVKVLSSNIAGSYATVKLHGNT